MGETVNPAEQRTHKNRLEAVDKSVKEYIKATDDAFAAVNDLFDAHKGKLADLDRAINDERTHRLKLAEEQRKYVDSQNRAQQRQIDTLIEDTKVLRSQSLWERLKWLFEGVNQDRLEESK